MTLLIIAAIVILIVVLCRDKKGGAPIPPGEASRDYGRLYGENAAVQQPLPRQNTAVDYTNRYPGSQPFPQPVPMQPQAAPVVKKPFSPIPLLLIAGVIFLFLGGIIFLTGTWDALPDLARACALLSASFIAFAVNVLAERKLKLPKTGLAFYILGCIFLPLALGGIGVFELMGPWFSFHGDGCMLVWALLFFCIAVPSLIGQGNYKSGFLAWMGLTALSSMWLFLCLFLCNQVLPASTVVRMTVFDALLFLYAAGSTLVGEFYLRRYSSAATPLSKAMLPYLYVQNILFAIPLLPTAMNAPLSAAVIGALMAVLFLNKRYISGGVHCGILGFCFCMLTALASATSSESFSDVSGFSKFIFTIAGMTFILLNISFSAGTRKETAGTFTVTGIIFAIPSAILCLCQALEFKDFLFLYIPLFMALIHFAIAKKNPVSSSTLLFCLFTLMLYSISSSSAKESNLLYMLLLIIAALLLLVQFFLNRRLWPLVLAVCTCAAVLLIPLPNAAVYLSWLCTAALLGGLIYAHITHRFLLERCCEWAGIPFLLISCVKTFSLALTGVQSWILAFAFLALIFLAELSMFQWHLRSIPMRSFCMDLSIWLGSVIIINYYINGAGIGWQIILSLILLVFTAANMKRRVNFAAIPMLILLFMALRECILSLELLLSDAVLLGVQTGAFILMLLLFSAMGRLLLERFCISDGQGQLQLDWALLAGVLPVCGAAATLDWHPEILSCLFLSVYSLLYIGRVRTHYIPALLASMFGCLTIFFHNVSDPFGILQIWKESEIKTAQILLYLLPMHLFILSLAVILPKKYRGAVHGVRFCMYCFTMFCLLMASLNFGRVEDALILSVFSFLILAASFAVKKLRWFTLGFSVLSLITIRMTWHFWKSLHWGIYLFLIGILLIGIAFYYEYAVRRAAANPEEPKKKIKLFKEWKW